MRAKIFLLLNMNCIYPKRNFENGTHLLSDSVGNRGQYQDSLSKLEERTTRKLAESLLTGFL